MKLVVNPPTPWPNWQAPVSTRKTRPTIRGHGEKGATCSTDDARRRVLHMELYKPTRMNGFNRKLSQTAPNLASA